LFLLQGSDITEAFEAHHITKTPEHLLKQFYVRAASEPRNSPYTFKDDGFYRTLKRRAQPVLQKLPSGPSTESKLCSDLLLVAFLLLATVAAATTSFKFGLLAGLILNFLVVTAHNFFHMKDNLRMYYFDLCLMASR
jgi:cytochrome b involved in lipid metabolism